MKLTKRGKVVFGTLFLVAFLASELVLGIPKAFSPTKAEALVIHKQAIMHTLDKYKNADQLNDSQLIELLGAVGFKGKALEEAWAISKKESHGSPLAHNGNRKTGDNSYGLFQVNMLDSLGVDRREQFGLASNAELLNPVVNAQIAYYMSEGGKDWSAWKGAHQAVVKAWLKKYPHKTTTTKAHKAKVKAKAKAKAVAKAKPTQKQ
jgi:hypothetical protein